MYSSESSDSDEERVNRRPRSFQPRLEYNRLEETYEFNERFRLNINQFNDVLEIISPYLRHETERNYALSPKLQLQIALHWLATGVQYHAVGDMHGVSKATVCRVIHRVTDAINITMFKNYVSWPQDVNEIVHGFHQMSGMPLVCGAVDGTLVKILQPQQHEAAFVDRKGNHSINVLLVCGPDKYFYYCCANWPGSVNDARVLRNSSLYHEMEQGWRPSPDTVLLGDSIYPLKPWLIPPLVRNPNDDAQLRFRKAHVKTRWVIEGAIGILKEKFPCLNFLRLDPVKACAVIKSCVTLCNITKDEAIEHIPNIEEEENEEEGRPDERGNEKLQFYYNHFGR